MELPEAEPRVLRRNNDELDDEILRRLGGDPKLPKEALAASLEVPVSWLTTRIQALQARNAIRIRPVLNLEKAGRLFVFCKLAINSSDMTGALNKLAERPEFVTVAAITGGKYNAFVYFTFFDMPELNDIIRNILLKIDGFAEMETSIISRSLLFQPLYLNYTSLLDNTSMDQIVETLAKETSNCDIDELDVAIIAELQSDQKKSLRSIARQYDVSPGTVRYRLQRLESEEIVRFISFVDAKELSLGCFLIVELGIEAEHLSGIIEDLRNVPAVNHLHEVVGASDLIAFVNTRDMQEAHAVLSEKIRPVVGIRTVGVRIIMDTFKLDPRWAFITAKD